MHLTEAQAVTLARKLLWGLDRLPSSGVEVLLCPPFTALSSLHKLLISTPIRLGGQNMHAKSQGAFTGEISPLMLAEFCQYVILGHSERRALFRETDEDINLKVRSAVQHGLVPVLCVGETLEERQAGQAETIIYAQLLAGLQQVGSHTGRQLVIAYEPVWAIGTGQTATPEMVNRLIAATIRPALVRLFGEPVGQAVRVLYGGSVNAGNAAAFLSQPEIDGALVGGASLDPDAFLAIVSAAL